MPLSKQISEQRKKKGLTQEELASLTNVTVRTIQRIESGESQPRSFTLKAIAEALAIPFEKLMEEEIQPVLPIQAPHEDLAQEESADHFLRLFCYSCFTYVIIPYVHFLIPARMLKKHSRLSPPVKKLAQKIIRGQIRWTITFHLLLLLTLAYNMSQARFGNRDYLISYVWIVLGMYLLNALIIGNELRKVSRLAINEPLLSS